MISQCTTEKEQSKLMHVKINLLDMTKFRLYLIHVRIRSLSRRNMTKETKEMLIIRWLLLYFKNNKKNRYQRTTVA